MSRVYRYAYWFRVLILLATHNTYSRIDYFLIDAKLMPYAVNAKYLINLRSQPSHMHPEYSEHGETTDELEAKFAVISRKRVL